MNQETPKDFSSLISAAANDHIKPKRTTPNRIKVKAARAQRRKQHG